MDLAYTYYTYTACIRCDVFHLQRRSLGLVEQRWYSGRWRTTGMDSNWRVQEGNETRHARTSYRLIWSLITCCAIAQSRVVRTAWVSYGNMETSTPHSSETSQVITMKLCTFDNVSKTNTFTKLGWNPPARGHSTHTFLVTSSFLPSFLPSFLLFFSCAPAQSKRMEIVSRTIFSKDAVWRKEVPSQKMLFSHLTFWGHFAPKPPKCRLSREIPAK